jgi:prepilin-type processing-associated H-X9-DG protein
VRSTYNQNTLLGHDSGQTGLFRMRREVRNPDQTVMYLDGRSSARCDYSFNYAKARHRDGAAVNQVYTDGHAATMGWDRMWGYTGLAYANHPFWNPDK